MLRSIFSVAALLVCVSVAMAHCQVPCGIYADQMRFEQLLEDEFTISKAQDQLNELADGEADAQTINQLGRWVTTKEEHATKIQDTITHYFLAQRIKSGNPEYAKQLMAAHGVIVAAMKCKQSADPDTAEALKTAILALYKAYEGKDPSTLKHSH